MTGRRVVSATIVLVVILAGACPAFDGHRRGFILGAGAGVGAVSWMAEAGSPCDSCEEFEHDWRSENGFATAFRIGYGFSDQWTAQWYSDVAWLHTEGIRGLNITAWFGSGGLEGTYYLRPDAPCAYLIAGGGMSNYVEPYEEDESNHIGVGFGVGGGYEFAAHWSILAKLTWSRPGTFDYGGRPGMPDDAMIDREAWTFTIAAFGLAY